MPGIKRPQRTRSKFTDFILDIDCIETLIARTLIAKSATDVELNRFRDPIRRGEKYTALEHTQTAFWKLTNKWGLTFNDARMIVPTELRKKLLNTSHLGHVGATKMTAEAKMFSWSNIS